MTQVSSKAIISKFFEEYPGIFMLPFTEEYCEKLGLDKHELLAVQFQISLAEGRLRIETVPSKNAVSIHHNSEHGAAST